uniref:Uncharacterized protein n=1 Tax=Candidatus Kentrum eta TaxID=2126337 RepID=A0A450VEU2_9GAMM|nr:MAG: hypothetical protein BECKH772A_GA0070896_101212 [Candidatus Kentron sp. H]VFJ98228.1 MAG: hypothetical protein BECKH772B_GA0070898_101292 [Candidatus Kentron sp. H]VFK03251.1 MAG: hypothetical protein BECKH772C_GA0070978_101212 [Candidatus Kentron sp. H]
MYLSLLLMEVNAKLGSCFRRLRKKHRAYAKHTLISNGHIFGFPGEQALMTSTMCEAIDEGVISDAIRCFYYFQNLKNGPFTYEWRLEHEPSFLSYAAGSTRTEFYIQLTKINEFCYAKLHDPPLQGKIRNSNFPIYSVIHSSTRYCKVSASRRKGGSQPR